MPYKVYLADDSITIQKVVELTLSEEDFEVTAFGDGQAALDAARKAMPDIILADIVMPRMDGYQLSKAVKQDPALKNIPVILLAGTFENFDAGLAAESAADSHIVKPFESTELINKVKDLIARTAAKAPEAGPFDAGALDDEPMEDAVFAEEAMDADPVDDLWSVVDMQSPDQPLAGATEVISEDELWERANLVSEPARPMPAPPADMADRPGKAAPEAGIPAAGPPSAMGGNGMSWDSLPVEAAVEGEESAAEAFLADEDDSIFMADEASPVEAEAEPEAELQAFGHPAEESGMNDLIHAPFADFADEDEAVEAKEAETEVPPVFAAPAVKAVPEAVRPAPGKPEAALPVAEDLRRLVEAKVRELISGNSSDVAGKVAWEVMPGVAEKVAWETIPSITEKIVWEVVPAIVEKIVWEIVPGLAEEIIRREIEEIKAGS